MKISKQMNMKTGIFVVALAFLAACSDKDNTPPPIEGPAPYALGVGVTANDGTTTNYVVKAFDLEKGAVSLENNGLTLVGYRDYSFANKSIFALGGFDETNVNVVTQAANGSLLVNQTLSFPLTITDMVQVDDKTMLGLRVPAGETEGNNILFYFIDMATQAVVKEAKAPVAPLVEGEANVHYTGWAKRGDQVFLSYMHMDASFNTDYVDKNYVAIFNYPEMTLDKIITDPRTGPSGAWSTKNGLFVDEKGDVYAMSSSNISNGFSQSKKPGGFLRIKNGEDTFDTDYFFNTDQLGGKISHIKYLGNGLVFAAISTLTNQTADDRWGDKALKVSIIDVYNETIVDFTEEGQSTNQSLIHNGVGGRSFPVLQEGNKVYYPFTAADGKTYVYAFDVANKTAKRGLEVKATFVGGIFNLK